MRIIITLVLLVCFCYSSATTDSLKLAYENAPDQLSKLNIGIQLVEHLQTNRMLDSALVYARESSRLAEDLNRTSQQYELFQKIYMILERQNLLDDADSILNLSLKLPIVDSLKAKLHIQKYATYIRKGSAKNNLEELDKARELLKEDTLGNIMGMYYASLGVFHYGNRNYLKALDSFIKGKNVISKNHNYFLRINHNLARIYETIGLFEESKKIHVENFETAKNKKDRLTQLFAYYGIANSNSYLKDYQGVKRTCFNAIELREQYGVSNYFGFVYSLLGNAYLEEERVDSAIFFIQKGIEISKKQQENNELLICQYFYALALHKKGQLDSALYYAQLAKNVIGRFEGKELNKLSEIFATAKNHEQAYNLASLGYDFEAKRYESVVQTISGFLQDKYKQEINQEKIAFQQKLYLQRSYGIAIILFLCLLGLILYIYLQFRNTQKLKLVNESLSERNEALRQFAYITSHDLKEPVRNIASFTQILLQNTEKGKLENQKKYLNFINNSSKTLHEIVNSIQTFTDVQFKNIEREEVNVEEAFQSLQATFSVMLEEKNATLNFHNAQAIQTIFFSKPMLLLVLQNLIQNGLKYNDKTRPEVSVEIQKKGDKHLFTVKDNGIGISAKYHTAIFEAFKTLANKSSTESSGLGLSICKNIIENYGGQIWVESIEKEGSTFSFII